MSQTFEVEHGRTQAVSSTSTLGVNVASGDAQFSNPGRLAHDIPQMIPTDEVLLWTPEWRALVAEAREDIASGEAEEFTNFRDLASWLLRVDDDD